MGFSGGKVRQVRESTPTTEEEKAANTARKSELKKKRSGDEDAIEINDMYIKDEQGNVEHHNVEVVHRKCSYVAGDYMPGHKICDSPCPMRSLCATNAVANKRITVNDEFAEKMKSEAQKAFGKEFAAAKAQGRLLVPQSNDDLNGKPAVEKPKPFPLKPRK